EFMVSEWIEHAGRYWAPLGLCRKAEGRCAACGPPLPAGPTSTCGIATSGALYCWGYNSSGLH
ncbi:MAG: hypothetical protein E6H72_14365, partial [Betaproteobacteria bacterium]